MTEIVAIIVPALTSIGLYVLARFKDTDVSKKDVYEQRLTNLYIPFYKKVFLFNIGLKPSDLSTTAILSVTDILGNNIHYMDTTSQVLFIKLFQVQLELIDKRENNKDLKSISKTFDTIFNELSNQLLKEHKHICKKLKLPEPVENI